MAQAHTHLSESVGLVQLHNLREDSHLRCDLFGGGGVTFCQERPVHKNKDLHMLAVNGMREFRE